MQRVQKQHQLKSALFSVLNLKMQRVQTSWDLHFFPFWTLKCRGYKNKMVLNQSVQILQLDIDFSIFRTHRNWVINFPKGSPPGGQFFPPIKPNKCGWFQLHFISKPPKMAIFVKLGLLQAVFLKCKVVGNWVRNF